VMCLCKYAFDYYNKCRYLQTFLNSTYRKASSRYNLLQSQFQIFRYKLKHWPVWHGQRKMQITMIQCSVLPLST